jgi:predicted transglutaminase-like cysteine proteinase
VEDESKPCITYVKALQFNQVCMVLTYFTDAYAETLVLDNLISAIGPGLVRHGLQI